MAQCQAASTLHGRAITRHTRSIIARTRGPVYKFMIMTLLHTSITYRILLPPLPPLIRFRSLCVRASASYTGVLCSPLSPFRRIVSDGTTTRSHIYIQPFVTVRKAADARVPLAIPPKRGRCEHARAPFSHCTSPVLPSPPLPFLFPFSYFFFRSSVLSFFLA
jgi:hypothetical protein